ncbi:MAG: glycosyltransferase family 39 protein, partial [candidate division FCPU426 bacterium]
RVEAYGLWNFVLDFNKLQGTLSTHAETHPFGPELLYVFLIKLVGRDPLRVAYAIMALAALAFVPVFLIAKRLFGSRWAGLAAGLLYLFSPVQLLLSGGGIDCLVTMMLAWILYFLQRSLEEDGPGLKKRINWAGRAGRFLFLTMLLTPGVMLPLLFCGLWVGWLALKRATGLKDWFTRIGITGGIFLASTLLMHLLLWAATGGRFVYLRVTNSGLGIQKSMPSVRPYATWVWLDAFLICAFCGLPLLAILLIRAARAAKNLDGRDGLLVSGLLFLGLVVFMSLGAAEAQRMFQYSILIFVLCSVPFVLGPRAAEEDAPVTEALNLPLLFLASALLFANTVVLASTILDFW